MSQLIRRPHVEHAAEITVVHDINAKNSELDHVSFKVLDMDAGAQYTETLLQQECCIVVMIGTVTVADDETTFSNIGSRTSVFERKPTDSVYISNDRTFAITASTSARVGLCYARSETQRPTQWIKAADVGREHRGLYNNQRLVHNMLSDSDTYANNLLVVEVYTESGNWSSYPPHKHDKDNLPEESSLEETYYHEIDPAQGFVVQRVYTDDLSLDETMTVRNRDVVIVPKGYHPVGVPDGYSSYYLNVMAGPKRLWKFYNDPDHAWILERK